MSTESRLALAFALSAALPTVLPAVVWAQDQAAGDSASVTSDGNGDVAPSLDSTSLDSTSLDSTDASPPPDVTQVRPEEHTPELRSLMRTAYAVFCLNKKRQQTY